MFVWLSFSFPSTYECKSEDGSMFMYVSTRRSTGIGFLVENLASAQFFFGLNRHERVRGKEKSTFARAGDLSYVTEPTFCQGLK
jgi:hypothetical protein